MQVLIFGVLLLLSVTNLSFEDLSIPRNPPEPWKAALMARYIMHACDWVSIATISTQESIKGYPFVGLKSLSDGPRDNSTGIPYLYMTDMDVSGKDILANNNVSIMATLAQSNYCRSENFDPQDPRCAKVLISGKIGKIEHSSPEYKFGLNSLLQRHPSMNTWPAGNSDVMEKNRKRVLSTYVLDHQFYVAKVNIENIEVLDFFGGIKPVTSEDYFNATLTLMLNTIIKNDISFDKVSVLEIRI